MAAVWDEKCAAIVKSKAGIDGLDQITGGGLRKGEGITEACLTLERHLNRNSHLGDRYPDRNGQPLIDHGRRQ